jgi:hypothetical protein
MPLVGLCELFGVSRSWYYERCCSAEGLKKAEHDVALRDAIERIVLEFPGATGTAGSRRRFTGTVGRSTTRRKSCV